VPRRPDVLEHAWKDGDSWYSESSQHPRQLASVASDTARRSSPNTHRCDKASNAVVHHSVRAEMRPEPLTAIMEGQTNREKWHWRK
jgi:hypothetical protein